MKAQTSSKVINAALGKEPADLLFVNARLVNVFTRSIEQTSVAVADGLIAGFGPRKARKVVDLKGRFLLPGLIDAHIHIESTLAGPASFGRAAAACGTTAVVADPHEIANVLGAKGLDYMLEAAKGSLADIFYMLPSCVPATNMESSGACLGAEDLEPYFDHPRVLGLAEVMNFPGVLAGDRDLLAKIAAAKKRGKRVDGHSPLLRGKELDAYIAAGMESDHECVLADEAKEKLEKGMFIMIREGTAARNLADLLPIVTPQNACRCAFCSDDRHPYTLLDDGHMDSIVRKAVSLGLDPATAIAMASYNTACHFGLYRRGAVAPGYIADLVVAEDIFNLRADAVYKNGLLVAQNGRALARPEVSSPVTPPLSINVAPESIDFSIPAGSNKARIIELVPGQVMTGHSIKTVPVADGLAHCDAAHDIAKLAVIERHRATGCMGKGFVQGFGLKKGAIAASIAHDSHNIIVAGMDDASMQTAAQEVIQLKGGMAVALGQNVLAGLALPIAGLMSEEPLEEIRSRLDTLIKEAGNLGCSADDPFMALSFLALPVIPSLKLTDKGLVDVEKFGFVELFV
ncbi:MAG: adenine deaminase [Desulfatibacillaceae bacterium]|nr:adenine deaminase [Desulfatibacillaceae bacterium]